MKQKLLFISSWVSGYLLLVIGGFRLLFERNSHQSLFNNQQSLLFLLSLVFLGSCFDEKNDAESAGDDFFQEENIPAVPNAENIQTGIPKTFTFDVGKETYSIDLYFQESIVEYFKKQPKVYTYSTRELPDNWEEDYYNMFITNRKDNAIFNHILYQINGLKSDMTDEELLQFVVNFVQGGLEYDWDSYFDVTDELRYPYETLFSEKGVCSDKSLVLGKLLARLGYETVFLTFPKANHMAVGLRVPDGLGNLGTDYAYIETTNYSSIGRVPTQFVGGITIEEAPLIIPIRNAGQKIFKGIIHIKNAENELESKYGEAYIHASATEKILLEEMHELNVEIENLKIELDNNGCEGLVSPQKMKTCTTLQKRVNQKVNTYNQKVERYNAMNEQPES